MIYKPTHDPGFPLLLVILLEYLNAHSALKILHIIKEIGIFLFKCKRQALRKNSEQDEVLPRGWGRGGGPNNIYTCE
jgi:hypothetical protein